MKYEILNALKEIFEKHKNERICVIGTMCCGKTTIIKQLSGYNCIDMDDEFWCQIPEDEIKRLSQKPITTEIMDIIYRLVHEKITIKPGFPLFGIAIHNCEAVVYLDISKKLLSEHCKARGDTSIRDALFVKRYVEDEWNNHKAKNDKVFYRLSVTEKR